MLDQLSPIAPARVRVVLLPIGQVKRARFLGFVDRLQPENVIRLGDISPDARPNRNMFTPIAFPTGMIVYDLTTFSPPPSHVALSPFELYREPLVIIALADGAEMDHVPYRKNFRRSLNSNSPSIPEHSLRELEQDLEDLRDRYPKALVHQLMIFDYVHKSPGSLPEGLIAVPPPDESKRTTMKTIMCDLSSILLAEMTTLAKSLQALNTIESPSQSQINKQYTGNQWPSTQDDSMSRRNSQFSLPGQGSRSGSPAGSADRSHVRMSMPAQLRRGDSNISSPPGRPSTPANGIQVSPTTLDDHVGSGAGDSRTLQNQSLPPLTSPDPAINLSRERVSIQGFGSNSVSELSRNRGKGRISTVIGSLYLAAGRWGDAMRELAEAATMAKSHLDHLWHAKALENILVSMLMLAWAGIDFQIPQICYASAEKTLSSPRSSDNKSAASNRLVSLQNLAVLLRELLDRILNLYARAANNTGESLPQFPLSDSVLRFSKLLSTIHLAGGVIDDSVLQLIVLGIPFSNRPNLFPPRLNIRPGRTEVVTFLFRAFPASNSPDTLSTVDRIIVFCGIASILSSLGYNRKKAMVIRELVFILVPGLVQARIKGAAEMGVHPAAGLAALSSVNGKTAAGALDLGEGDIENGVDTFLGLLGQTYGVVTSRLGSDEKIDDSDDSVLTRIVQNAEIRSFGGQNLKIDVLRACINLSEALPDFHGVLKFTTDLLRTAGSGVAPGPRSEDASPALSREEQVRLASNISRTIHAARNLGVKDISAEYWDEFLVRGIEVDAPAASRTPIPHRRSEIPGAATIATSRDLNPFIYNPFLRTPDTSATDHLLVAGEVTTFKVTLQNPYEFDVEVDSVKLETEGVDFESSMQKTVIGPYRTQTLGISGTPKSFGQFKVTGCIVRIRGCRERRFPIFQEPWSPQRQAKVKAIGVASLFRPKDRPLSVGSGLNTTSLIMPPPKIMSLTLNVIDKQPVVTMKSNTLSQSAVMVLEGERQVFSITLQNLSKDTPVDLLLFSFKDSTQAPLQAAMSNRDASPAELYECELIFVRRQALRWKKKEDEKPFIAPGATATFEIELLGKPGLTSAIVQVDYAHLGVPESDIKENFHTRQLSIPITITVNASIELARVDLLPLAGTVSNSLWSKSGIDLSDLRPEEYCLLILDLRNAWPSQLNIHLSLTEANLIDEEILPGNTSRIMFPVRRIYLQDAAAPIPALDPSRQRQFVVSTGRMSVSSERASREAFWYREEVLKMLGGTWTTKSGPQRIGEIELRGIRLSQRMIDAVKVDEIGITISVNGSKQRNTKHEVLTDSCCDIKVHLVNRTPEPIFPLLRIQPSVRNQYHQSSLDLSKKFVWNGTLQQMLPILPGNGSTEVTIGMTPLCRGEFEISASVEEAKIESSSEADKDLKTRQRANTRSMMDTLLGTRERRIWSCREGCVILVGDGSSSDDEQ